MSAPRTRSNAVDVTASAPATVRALTVREVEQIGRRSRQLREGTGELTALMLGDRETAHPALPRKLGQQVEVLAGQRRAARGADAAHPPALRVRVVERAKPASHEATVQSSIANPNRRSGLSVPYRSSAFA